jgi:hypothetical protein
MMSLMRAVQFENVRKRMQLGEIPITEVGGIIEGAGANVRKLK